MLVQNQPPAACVHALLHLELALGVLGLRHVIGGRRLVVAGPHAGHTGLPTLRNL